MHLIPCNHPAGLLEPAPRSSVSACADGGCWDGFWSVADERYYARLTRANGRQEWFRFADEEVAILPAREPRVLPLRRRGARHGARQTLFIGTRGGRVILVGRSRRGDRAVLRGRTR